MELGLMNEMSGSKKSEEGRSLKKKGENLKKSDE
jgi:hypothetical protein